jgi:hypothetical protein
MTELPVIVVYCEGAPNDPHDRFIVAAYQRTHTTPTTTPALWTPLKVWNGRRLRKVEISRYDNRPDAPRRMWLGYRFPCDECQLDGLRVYGERDDVGDKIYAVFDGLWAHGSNPLEISVRGLLNQIGR